MSESIIHTEQWSFLVKQKKNEAILTDQRNHDSIEFPIGYIDKIKLIKEVNECM